MPLPHETEHADHVPRDQVKVGHAAKVHAWVVPGLMPAAVQNESDTTTVGAAPVVAEDKRRFNDVIEKYSSRTLH